MKWIYLALIVLMLLIPAEILYIKEKATYRYLVKNEMRYICQKNIENRIAALEHKLLKDEHV